MDGLPIKVTITSKVEKYADDVSQADIEAGLAVPLETIEVKEEIEATPENLSKLRVLCGDEIDKLIADQLAKEEQ